MTEIKTFQVKAVDGDVGINSTISYDILKNGCDGYTCEIKIDENNGSITVGNVDREEVGDTIQVTLNAIEQDDNSSTPLSVVFLIEDQDDNIPSITFDGKTMDRVEIQKDENYVGSIIDFDVTDMDLVRFLPFSLISEI
ncbi:hypothetical protein HHI36_013349 [Cryptolaemus montrouzieri]|uniref:Cadherin domain-containing protein n=1 Tax=Cryptolaemus montrouzieri TaxID=559131 RepID=A0ABD2NHZ6_9CUCU